MPSRRARRSATTTGRRNCRSSLGAPTRTISTRSRGRWRCAAVSSGSLAYCPRATTVPAVPSPSPPTASPPSDQGHLDGGVLTVAGQGAEVVLSAGSPCWSPRSNWGCVAGVPDVVVVGVPPPVAPSSQRRRGRRRRRPGRAAAREGFPRSSVPAVVPPAAVPPDAAGKVVPRLSPPSPGPDNCPASPGPPIVSPEGRPRPDRLVANPIGTLGRSLAVPPPTSPHRSSGPRR